MIKFGRTEAIKEKNTHIFAHTHAIYSNTHTNICQYFGVSTSYYSTEKKLLLNQHQSFADVLTERTCDSKISLKLN